MGFTHLPLSKSLSRWPAHTVSSQSTSNYSSSAISTNRHQSEVIASHPVLLPLTLLFFLPPSPTLFLWPALSARAVRVPVELLKLQVPQLLPGVQLPSSEYVSQIGHKREQ